MDRGEHSSICVFFQGRRQHSLPTMEGNFQKVTPLARELTRVFNSYNKHTIQLKKNLKETNLFFREIRQNYSNACASAVSSEVAALEAGKHLLHNLYYRYLNKSTCLSYLIG